jgi:hypothetical protein
MVEKKAINKLLTLVLQQKEECTKANIEAIAASTRARV